MPRPLLLTPAIVTDQPLLLLLPYSHACIVVPHIGRQLSPPLPLLDSECCKFAPLGMPAPLFVVRQPVLFCCVWRDQLLRCLASIGCLWVISHRRETLFMSWQSWFMLIWPQRWHHPPPLVLPPLVVQPPRIDPPPVCWPRVSCGWGGNFCGGRGGVGCCWELL